MLLPNILFVVYNQDNLYKRICYQANKWCVWVCVHENPVENRLKINASFGQAATIYYAHNKRPQSPSSIAPTCACCTRRKYRNSASRRSTGVIVLPFKRTRLATLATTSMRMLAAPLGDTHSFPMWQMHGCFMTLRAPRRCLWTMHNAHPQITFTRRTLYTLFTNCSVMLQVFYWTTDVMLKDTT